MTTEAKPKPIEPSSVHSERLFDHATDQLKAGDRLQASEKLWGAVAHRLQVIARARGWKTGTHKQFYGVVERLAKEVADPQELQDLYGIATGLHSNFYRDMKTLSGLRYEHGRVRRLLEILNRPELLVRPSRKRRGRSRPVASAKGRAIVQPAEPKDDKLADGDPTGTTQRDLDDIRS